MTTLRFAVILSGAKDLYDSYQSDLSSVRHEAANAVSPVMIVVSFLYGSQGDINTNLNLKVIICGVDFSFCLS